MFGDGLTWCAIISLPYGWNKNKNYLVEKLRPQPRLLQVLKDLPVCTGVGVRRDVVGISIQKTVELNGFLTCQRWQLQQDLNSELET